MVTPIRDILKMAAKNWGLAPAARLVVAREAWSRIVGIPLAEVSAPLSIRDGRLRVAVIHAAAAQEIRLRRDRIASTLNSELGEQAVSVVTPVARRRLPEVSPRLDDRRRMPHRPRG
jgi:predicted nucleic acid-binding Zn ribbon protein